MINQNLYNRGFSLMEMIVAVGVFTVAITMVLSIFLNLSFIQRKAEAIRAVNDNMNFTLEIMAREIRMGSGYGGGGISFSFTNSDNCAIIYNWDLNDKKITRQNTTDSLPKCIKDLIPMDITPPEVYIDKLEFIVDGIDISPSDKEQPRVTIIIKAKTGKTGEETALNLQTMVSQRELDQ